MKKIIMTSAVFSLVAALSACGGNKDKVDEDTSSRIHISVADATAGWVNGNIELSFRGASVLDANQQPVSELTVAGNEAADITITAEYPASGDGSLSILARAEGYLDGGKSLILPSRGGEQSVSLRLTQDRPGSVADGVFSTHLDISDSVDSTGTVTQDIELLSRESPTAPALKVTIPAGTQLLDEDGNPVVGGVLKLTSFDPSKPRALLAYPGGMNVLANVDGFTGIDGSPATGQQQINFKTAGFASIVIEGNDGRRVKQFSQDIEIAMQFAIGTTDADGNVVQVGDAVPIWSFDETTGEWSFEEDGTAADLDSSDGLLDVVYNTNHLTAWNLDWHYGEVCTANINVIDSLGINQLSQVHHLIVSIDTSPALYRYLLNNNPSNGDFLLYNTPLGYSATVTAYDANGVELGSLTSPDLCGGNAGPGGWSNDINNEVDLVIDVNAPPVDVSLTVSCPISGVNVPGSNSSPAPLPVVLSPTNGGSSITLPNGSGPVGAGDYSLSGIPGGSSLVNAIDWGNSGNPANNLITISGNGYGQDFVLSNAFCSPTAGNIDSAACDAVTTGQYSTAAPFDVAEDSEGNLYISTGAASGILKKDTSGNITTFISPGNSNYSNYPSANPTASNDEASEVTAANALGLDIYSTPNGDILLYADRWANCINAVNLGTGTVATVVGKCQQAGGFTYSTDVNNRVTATDGRIWQPTDVAADPVHQVLYLTVAGRVLMVSADNDLWSVAGSGAWTATTDITTPVDALTNPIRPYMLDVDPQGRPVFSEPFSHRVLRVDGITLTGLDPLAAPVTLSALAGSYAQAGFGGDGLTANGAMLNSPRDIEIDSQGNILVADHFNNRVRRIDASTGVIDTVAGTGGTGSDTVNGCGMATQTDIRGPNGLWFQPNADFYLTQGGSAAQRMVRHVTY